MDDSLRQYAELFREHGSQIENGCPEAMNERRGAAFRALEKIRLPESDSENYEFTDLASILRPDYGVPLVPADTPRPAGPGRDYPAGVFAGSIREFASQHPEILTKYYGSLASVNNPVVALNTLLAQDGFVLYIPCGVRVERAIQIVNRMDSDRAVISPRRLLVILEEGAEAKLLNCDHTDTPDSESLALCVTEIYLAKGASFDYYELEESAEKSKRLSALHLRQEEGSRAVIDSMTLFNGFTRNEFYCDLAGEQASLRLLGMGICDRNRKLSVYSHINHGVPHCHSDELFRMSADDMARCSFTGRIHVAQGAMGTEAYQASRNLVSGNEAVIKARPELEIYNDDVKCSHGCAIGQLDELQMFYMRTRGLPEATARLLLRQAFMADIVDAIAIPSLRDRLHILVERRFAGLDASCNCDVRN